MSAALSGEAATWESGPGYRRTQVLITQPAKAGFTLLPGRETGITFSNSIVQERLLASQVLPSGSGVAAGDVDGDGRCDLYFCSLRSGNRLYRNLGGWKFEDITAAAGVGCPHLDATGAALVDLDGDGDLDLVVNSLGGGTRVFFNDGNAKFSESAVLNTGKGGMSMALADVDGDGWLDLYVANYRVTSIMDAANTRWSVRPVEGRLTVTAINGKPITDPEWTNRFLFKIVTGPEGKFAYEELGEADVLHRNLGKGRFEPVSFTGGSFLDEDGKPLEQPPFDWGLTVAMRDLNGDGKPDIYVCNDFRTPDRLWINDGAGRFRLVERTALRQQPLSCMSIDVADINRDGYFDVFVVDMLSRDHQRRLVQRNNIRPELLPPGEIENRPQYPRNILHLNRGDGTWCEAAQFFGLDASEWSWAPLFIDVDLDGFEDLLVTNGFERDNMNLDAVAAYDTAYAAQKDAPAMKYELRRLFPKLATSNLAFQNLKGTAFVEVGKSWGFDTPAISQGACLADLDADGDQDVIVNNLNEMAGIYRNDAAAPRLAVRLKGLTPNTHGIGARIRVLAPPLPPQAQEILAGGRYLSSDEPIRVFAAGTASNKARIEVDWRSGKHSVIEAADANYIYEIDEAAATAPAPPAKVAEAKAAFADATSLLAHGHRDDLFDDFARQPALGKRLSQLGPGLCWADVNDDGFEDLAVAAGKGGRPALFLNNSQGGFKAASGMLWELPASRDQGAVVACPQESGGVALLFASCNYEDGQSVGGCVFEYAAVKQRVTEAVPGLPWSVGALSLGDMDGDGSLELFVGGRVKAGQYPAPVSSRIYRCRNGQFELDEKNSKLLDNVGMVSGAVWSDLNEDGFPELLLALEWGPVRVWQNERGQLRETNCPLADLPTERPGAPRPRLPPRLAALTGWWNGVTTGDIDGDGRMDIIAANWGQNTKYEFHRAQPLRVYYGDWNEDSTYGLLETYFEAGMAKYAPERRLDQVAPAMPFLRATIPSHQAFAEAGAEDILGPRMSITRSLDAAWLESTLFLNRGTNFQTVVLPQEAQMTPAHAVLVADYDGDGAEDVFLSQNFFAVEPETSRYDGGCGLWLRGDGKGGLRSVPPGESGVRVWGEQRGAAVADYDNDGRIDLVVSQNAAATRLFRNTTGKAGLRLRLKGPPGNPWGIGTQVRLKFGDRFGPVRELHAGSGYWSQDSAVQVLATPSKPTHIWLRWPGGKVATLEIPEDAAEVLVSVEGQISRVR